MDRKNEKSWNDDLDDVSVKDELDRISERIERIVKTFEEEGRIGKTDRKKEKRGG